MAFVNEQVKDEFITVDKDRNIILRRKNVSGGSSERINVFELDWNDAVVRFSARPSVIENDDKGDFHHEILSLEIPEKMQGSQSEIIQDIKAALDAFGAYWNRDKCNKVTVSSPDEFENFNKEVCDGV